MSWLFIDTSRPDRFRFGALASAGSKITTVHGRSNRLLPALSRQFSFSALRSLRGICVVHGPGAFSSVRGGVLAANLLARLLKKPLAGVRAGDAEPFEALATRLESGRLAPSSYVMPTYVSEPNITVCHS